MITTSPATDTLLAQHAEAMHTATTLVSQVRQRDLLRQTPCADWSLADLLAHMVGQHRGFARAARDGHAPVAAYRPERFTVEGWLDSAFGLLAAFAEANPRDGIIAAELHPTKKLSFDYVLGAQLLDTVVHTWDVARAINLPFAPTDGIATAVLGVAQTIPDTPARKRPGSAFAPALTAAPAASDWEQALALLGRSGVASAASA